MTEEPAAEPQPTRLSTGRVPAGRDGAGIVTGGRITNGRAISGGVRTSLPVRAGGEGWRYPEGDGTAVVRGED